MQLFVPIKQQLSSFFFILPYKVHAINCEMHAAHSRPTHAEGDTYT